MERVEFKKIVDVLGNAFAPGMTKEQSEAYYSFLKKYEYQLVAESVAELIKTREGAFIPPIGEIIAMIVNKTTPLPDETFVKEDILKAIRDYGVYSDPIFEHPVSQAVVEDMGWGVACGMEEAEFINAVHFRYERAARQWIDCAKTGREFPINEIQGIFSRRTGTKTKSLKESVAGYLVERA